jgi:hypothetical protein
MARFEQALDWLNEGKKVRRNDWLKGNYIVKDFQCINDQTGSPSETDLYHILCDDWELYEEKPEHLCKLSPISQTVCQLINGKLVLMMPNFFEVEVIYCPYCGKQGSE